ncbi:MAG: 30S ribosome-binding factor RbfA [Candidatus Staskawiczbacteria bacterium]|nr:30S ribosome-binding factor RbfA [Candidatus Staskawiczbacteria bacterium]
MSNRLEKVNSLLAQEISKIIARDFSFKDSLVTLTHVDTSPNLIETKAYISVLPEDKTDQIIKVLNSGVYDVQQKINKLVNMRPVPKIRFIKDRVLAEASKIEAILETLKKEQK